MTRPSPRTLARPVVAALYAAKRRYRIGDRFFSNHPRAARAVMSMLAPLKDREVVDANGHRLVLDANDSLGLSIIHVYEPEVTEYVRRTLRWGDLAVDVGAHIGYFTLLFAQLVGSEGRVFAFEPEASKLELLQRNVAANGYGNVTARSVALGERAGTGAMLVDPFNSGGARLVRDSFDGATPVEIVAVDDEYPELKGPARLIKVDAEGQELSVLHGMRSTLEASPGVSVVTEFTPGALESAGTPSEELLRFLGELGFRPHCLRPNGSTVSVSVDQLLGRAGRGDATYVNVVFERTS